MKPKKLISSLTLTFSTLLFIAACSSQVASTLGKSTAGQQVQTPLPEEQKSEIETGQANGDEITTTPTESATVVQEQTTQPEDQAVEVETVEVNGDDKAMTTLTESTTGDQKQTPQATEPTAAPSVSAAADKALTLSDIPLYPGATPYERGQHPLFEEIIGSIGDLQLPEGYEAESYTVPPGTTAKTIENFYNGELTKLGWQMEWGGGDTPTSGADDKVLSSLGWGNRGRSFIITFWEFPQSTLAPILITSLIQDPNRIEDPFIQESRWVEGPVIPLSAGHNGQAPDLLILNRGGDNSNLFLSYRETDSNAVRWDKELTPGYITWPEVKVAFDESQIYLATSTPHLQALNQADGALIWETSLTDRVAYYCLSCLLLFDERLIVLTRDRVLHGVNTANGELVWSIRPNADPWPGPFAVGQQIGLMDEIDPANFGAAALHLFNPEDGTLQQRITPACSAPDNSLLDLTAGVSSPFFIDEAGERAYFILDGASWVCAQGWDIAGGQLIWQATLPKALIDSIRMAPIMPGHPFLLGPETLYAGGPSPGQLIGLNLADGQSRQLALETEYTLLPLLEQDQLLLVQARREEAGSEQYELWGLDAVSGVRLWQYNLQAGGLSFSPDYSSGGFWGVHLTPHGVGVIQVLPDDRILVEILDQQTGQVIQQTSAPVENVGPASPNVAWTDDTAYLTLNSALYSVNLATGTVTNEMDRLQTQIQSPAEPATIAFSSATLGFTLDYPKAWHKKEEPGQVVFSPATDGLDLGNLKAASFRLGRVADDKATVADLLADILANFPPDAETLIEGTINIASQTWTSVQIRFDDEQLGGQGVATIAVTNKEGTVYFLVAVAPATQWNAVQPFFQEMINSFRFTDLD